MAAGAALDNRPNGSSSRERQSTRPDNSSSPQAIRTAPSSSIASQATLSSQLLTVDGLLATHANTNNPALAALEAAVAERNTLSSQNTQLWKLIEKQRSGYGQLMKELERVRGERDMYRKRLQGLGEDTDTLLRAHREREKHESRESALRSASSHSHLRTSESDPRQHLLRTASDESTSRGLHHSHSHEPVSRTQSSLREEYGSQTSLDIPPSNSHTSSSVSSPQSSQPASSSVSANHSPHPRDATPEGRRPPALPLSPTQDSFSTHSRPSLDSAPALSPHAIASSAVDVADPVLGQWHPQFRPSLEAAPAAQVVLTPATPAQAAHPRSPSPTRQPHMPPLPPQPHFELEKQSSASTLSPLVNGNGRSFALSRDSRISLPEEAKRYYANLTDTPVTSPAVNSTGFPAPSGSGPNSPIKPHMSQIVETAESVRGSLDMPSEAGSGMSRARGRSTGEEGAPFLDMGDGESVYSGVDSSVRTSNDAEDRDENPFEPTSQQREQGASESTAVDDFPLPPSTPGYVPITNADGESVHLTVQSIQQPSTPVSPFLPMASGPPQLTFRALPLLAADLPHTEIHVVNSTIRPNDRGKEVLSFVIFIKPGGKEPWKVEKLYSDVLALDARVRSTVGKSILKRMVTLPEGRLWRDHAPAKMDQRKNALEQYLRSLIALPVKNKDEIIAFFTSDIVRETQKPVAQAGYKEGYLTKRGKNFGGWKTRYFVLQGPSLEYYESRGGAHLGSITITGAQIGRQQRTTDRRESDEDNEYRHAFLIIEAKRGPGGSRHVLCAGSDEERDSWVEELVRYVSGTYSEDQVAVLQNGPSPLAVDGAHDGSAQPRSSTSSAVSSEVLSATTRRSRDTTRSTAAPARITTDTSNAKLFPNTIAQQDEISSPAKAAPSPVDHLSLEGATSSSLPTSSPLVGGEEDIAPPTQRANSELGHYPDLVEQRYMPKAVLPASQPERYKNKRRVSVNPLKAAIPERTPSPEKDFSAITPRVDAHGKVKISGPMNGTPIPAGYKFGGKDAPAEAPTSTSDKREKTKSRTFWGFGRQQHDKPSVPALAPRAVFGVSLDESLDVAQIASLPAIVFRCIQYLEAKEADQEEGIYRLSGSNAVIKSLKDRFNTEGDVDLLGSDEYWDPHAIAGLLKTFMRELPASILTRDLHLRFLSVMDFVDPQERIQELSRLVAALPIANYSLLRALTAHLILIVQNANVNKMTMRNVGIVFSPTLGIPAGVFSLMLGEFKRVFNVDGTLDDSASTSEAQSEQGSGIDRRNSTRYTDAAADQLLGLSGRALPVAEEAPSDEGEEVSIVESADGTAENDSDRAESSAASSSAYLLQGASYQDGLRPPERGGVPDSLMPGGGRTRASNLAAARGLNIAVADKASHRRSGIVGLPPSPRPSPRPTPSGAPSPAAPSPLSTPK
ncbi:RhoGAP-domain-containing protein [Wolfiporia cocos MD-104 SS10]|uniref:RhoGAP-domain-containing protein n=1 Tax=Wolfiporia cocos (strain MD-104) TaxID=742152 RepID=A0A2H3K7I1_WOLCO|nr:RhoGAP-domain-containing protein [Wolfiporia cocos MD-104 SS10]